MARTSPSSAAAKAESVVPKSQSQARTQSKKKRTNDPGIRIKGSRTYDSANGTTCHQCRQKTRDFAALCKNWKGNKQCKIKLCLKCLENRYGEKAEEVALLSDWNCPKCRGICNCSFCMKKRGQRPTGILVHAAKKSGFSSVSEMLNMGHVVDNLNDADSMRKGSKRPRISKEFGIDEMHSDVSLEKDDSSGLDLCERYARCEATIDGERLQESGMSEALDQDDAGSKLEGKRYRPEKVIEDIQDEEVQSHLRTVAGIDFTSEFVGHALQFLEFCASFGKALQLREGRAESVFLEVIQGQDRRRCQYSSTVQLHVQMLTLIKEDSGGKSPSLSPADESSSSIPTDGGNSWVEAFQKCVSEVPMEALPVNLDRYADTDRSEKLRLLNFICDEALGTDYLRDSIDNQNTTFAEKKEETNQKVVAAKDKLNSPRKRRHKQEAAYPILAGDVEE